MAAAAGTAAVVGAWEQQEYDLQHGSHPPTRSSGASWWKLLLPPTRAEAPAAGKKYTKAEVAKHKTKETGIWVTFKDGVYDITEFVAMHPGGAAKIMMAAGGPVEPFWGMYQQHFKPEVGDVIKEYRIGTLSDYQPPDANAPVVGDPWAKEPPRHPALIPRSEKPFNGETPGHILAGSIVTSTDLFYIRNHLPVPHLDGATWKLTIEGEGLKRVELDLESLKRNFKKHTITATVECSGNRRNEMTAIKPVKGLEWDVGAIGTATWAGVRLRDVLAAAGLDPNEALESDSPLGTWHLHFVGADTDPISGEVYQASIPLEWAASPAKDVLLVYEMNGKPLTVDHGFPVRVLVPGVVGARSVKWLTKVVASKQECQGHWQQRDYKSFNPNVDWDTVDWNSAPAIQEAPITSAICEPAPGTDLPKGAKEIKVRGYAWSGGGRDIARVDVTADGGKTWTTAELIKSPDQRPGRAWAWSLFEAYVPVPAGKPGAPVELASRAVDESYNVQPDSVSGIWNLRGVVNNAWHRVKVNRSV